MRKIILDNDTIARLHGLAEQLEVCNPTCEVLGRILPEAIYQKLLHAVALAQRPPLSPEEVVRRRHETGGRSLAEILKTL